MPPCVCREPGAALWAQDAFGDCLYSPRDVAGFALGLASIGARPGCWLVAQLPQVLANARNGSADALSPWFLAEWLLGDSCNLAGCLLTGDQLPTQTFTAVYYLGMDVIMLSQFAYYRCGCARRRRERAITAAADDALREAQAPLLGGRGVRHASLASLLPALLLCCSLSVAAAEGALGWASIPRARGGPGPGAASFCGAARRPEWASRLGAAAGWASAAAYAGSRLSQLARNAARRSAAGLAPGMFALALGGNGAYAASVLLRVRCAADVARAAPWLAGSLGVMCMDAVLLTQALAASRPARPQQQLPAAAQRDEDDEHHGGECDGAGHEGREGDGAGVSALHDEQNIVSS